MSSVPSPSWRPWLCDPSHRLGRAGKFEHDVPKLEVSPIPGSIDLTVISWNVDGWHTIRDAQVELIDASGAELALLQEVDTDLTDLLAREPVARSAIRP